MFIFKKSRSQMLLAYFLTMVKNREERGHPPDGNCKRAGARPGQVGRQRSGGQVRCAAGVGRGGQSVSSQKQKASICLPTWQRLCWGDKNPSVLSGFGGGGGGQGRGGV